MKLFIAGGLAGASLLFAGCSPRQPAENQPPSPRPAGAAPATYIADQHPLPAWARKLNPAAGRASARLDTRYTVAGREALVRELNTRQAAVQSSIHLRFAQMPPAATLDAATARSTEEGKDIVSAQDKVYDDFRREYHLTREEMDALSQQASDNHWH